MMKSLPYEMHLKIATKEDASTVYDLVEEAVKDSDLPNHLHTFQDLQTHLENFISSPDNVVILLCNEHAPLGIFAGARINTPSAFLFKPYATEIVWWVDPVGRKGRNPWRMLEAFEYWAREKKCEYTKLSLLTKFSRKEMKRLNKIYRKKGYNPFETSYFKVL